MMYLYQKIETYLNRKVDFINEVKLESKNIFEADKFVGFEELIKEWNAPEPEPTEAELAKITEYRNPCQAQIVRAERDRLIAETDWTQNADVNLPDDIKDMYKIYRQELRDIPKQAGFPYNVIFPVKP